MYGNAGREILLNPSASPGGGVPGQGVRTRGGVFGPQGYGGGIFDGMSGVGLPVGQAEEGSKYPWLQFSEATQSLQFATNVELRMRDMPPIATDGYLGPETCGAQQYLHDDEGLAEHKPPGTCQAFQYPPIQGAPAPEPGGAPEPPGVKAPEIPKRAGMGLGTTGFVLVAAAVAAGGVYFATRKKRR